MGYQIVPIEAGSGLTAGANFVVKTATDSGTKVAQLQATTTGQDTLGILLNNPSAGEVAQVCIEGWCLAKASAAITPFDYVACHTDSKVIGASGANVVIGQYIPQPDSGGTISSSDCAAGDLIRIYVSARKLHPYNAAG